MKSILIITSVLIAGIFTSCQSNKTPDTTETPSNDTTVVNPPATASIFDKYWKLVEVNGTVVSTSGDSSRQAHMILNTADSRIDGNGGCNSYSGQYTLGDGNKISFSNIASTKMACDHLNTEGLFFAALGMTETYSMQNDTLTLKNAGTTALARFVTSP